MFIESVQKKAVNLETKNQHSDYITALRGISILSIIMLHVFCLGSFFKLGPEFKLGPRAVPYITYLTMGAPYFLFLSAYSLCLSYFKKSKIDITSFYIRRFFRIAPLFYFMTLICILWDVMHLRNVPRMSVIGNVFFIYNFMPQHGYFKGIIGAGWFIGVIIPFYLFFPLILSLSQKFSRVIWFFIISLVISFIFRLSLLWLIGNDLEPKLNMIPGDLRWYGECSLITNLPYFVMGIIAYHITIISAKYGHSRMIGIIMFVLTIIAFIGLPNMSDQYLANPVPLKYIIGLLFIPLTLSLNIYENRLIVNKFTVFIGKISYSLYIVHAFTIQRIVSLSIFDRIYMALQSDWLAFICCYVLTVFIVTLISIFTYKFIELLGVKLGDFSYKKLQMLFF